MLTAFAGLCFLVCLMLGICIEKWEAEKEYEMKEKARQEGFEAGLLAAKNKQMEK